MRKLVLKFLAITMIVGFSADLMAQTNTSATENTTAGAVLIKAMTLTETAPLHFGSVVLIDVSGGTVTLPSNNTTRVFGSAGVEGSAATPVATNAAYNVTGTALETYALSLPTTTTVTTGGGGAGETMDITLMTARFNGAGSDATTSTLSAAGTDSFTLGGTLTVGASQVDGVYTGTFDVTVDYN